MCNQSFKNRGIRWRFKGNWVPVNHKMFMLPLLDVTTRHWFPNHETIPYVTQFISPSSYFCHKLGWITCVRGEYPAVEGFILCILWKAEYTAVLSPHFLCSSIIVSLRQYGWVSHSPCCFNRNANLNYKWRKWSQKVVLGLSLSVSLDCVFRVCDVTWEHM